MMSGSTWLLPASSTAEAEEMEGRVPACPQGPGRPEGPPSTQLCSTPAGLCPGPLPCRLKGSRTRGGVCPQPRMLCRAEDMQTGPGLPEKQRPWPLTPGPRLSPPHSSALDSKTVPAPALNCPLPQPQTAPSLSLLPAHHPPHPAQTPIPCAQALGARQPHPGRAVHTPTAGSPADLAPDRVSSCPLHMSPGWPSVAARPVTALSLPCPLPGPGASGWSLFTPGPGWEAGVTRCLPS